MDQASFTAVVVSHAHEDLIAHILGQLRYQTRRPDETLVCACCADCGRLVEQFPEATFVAQPHRGDWGHADRAFGLRWATGDYVGFFNSDDSYEPDYLNRMLGAAERAGADVVYCAWNAKPDCEFRLGSSTSGNFIARTALAREVGYPETAVYENDGHFIDALAAVADPIVYLPEILYHHNVPGHRRYEHK